jgi:hypothetical protein
MRVSTLKPAARAVASTRYGVVATGEPVGTAQWESLPPGQLTTPGATAPAQQPLPNLAQFWRAIGLER